MDEPIVAEENGVETETTQTSSPQVESPITGDETIQGEAAQVPVVEEADVTNTMTEEQRKAFQDQRLENKRLKEELGARPKESAFNTFRAQAPQVSGPVIVSDYTDPITGDTDWQNFNQAQQIREQQVVQNAEARANQIVDERLDEQNARAKFPELMNDPVTEKQIASRWLYEKVQGNNVSVSDIASEFARNFKQAVSKAEKVGAERILNEVSEKEKAGLTATSQSSQSSQTSQEDNEKLSVGTRIGDDDAITARISKIPWANK